MFRGKLSLLGLGFVLSLGGSLKAATDTFIESADGKRLVRLQSPEINTPYHEVSLADSDKPLVYVHGKEVLKDIHDEAIFYVDGDVRHTSSGVKIATFDGEGIRHADRGKLMINYHHPDLSADANSNRIYRVNGPQLTPTELVAVLYVLKPEMFKLTDAEVAEQQKAMAQANAEEEKKAAADQIAGKWMVLNSNGPVEKLGRGSIIVHPKKGQAYPVDLDLSLGGGPKWQGVGVYKAMFGDKLFWLAYGTEKQVGMCVYEIKGGSLTGTWYPWYVDGTEKTTGSEVLKGPETLDGDYAIESAKAPYTGAAYTGTVSIHPAKIVGKDDNEAPYTITWTIGGAKVNGIGIKHKNFLFVASGAGADVNIAAYQIQNGNMNCDWYKLGSTEKGGAAATLMN
jgi:hypothetical protein